MTEPKALALNDIRLAFADIALRFDGTIKAGGITAVTGVSGSGKSTLFNLIAGFEQPDSGHIHVFGKDMAGLAPAERPVSVVFQDHNLFAHLDIFTNVGLGADPAMRLTNTDRARIDDALAHVGLAGFGPRSPQTLSGGERQRVALARALVRKRPLLLLDEPFAALDPGLRTEMTGLLRDLHKEAGNTILMITHHPGDVENLADDVLFLDRGTILLHAPTDRFLRHSFDVPQVARFLGNMPASLP